MCFQISGLKSKTKVLRNESTLQRHHTEQVYTRLNAAHGTKMFLVRWASAAGTTCAQPNLLVRWVSAAAPQGKWGRPGPLARTFLRQTGDVLSLPSYLAEIWRPSSSRSCTAAVPETLQTGGWQPPLEGAQTSSGHFKGEIEMFQSKGSDKNLEASIEIIAVVIWQP